MLILHQPPLSGQIVRYSPFVSPVLMRSVIFILATYILNANEAKLRVKIVIVLYFFIFKITKDNCHYFSSQNLCFSVSFKMYQSG